jgi:hypothetical protein
MSTDTIRAGGLLVLDPGEDRYISMDWDSEGLPVGIDLADADVEAIVIRQSGETAMICEAYSFSGSARTVLIHLDARTASLGDKYRVDCTIVTDEDPAQTIPRSFEVLIQDK